MAIRNHCGRRKQPACAAAAAMVLACAGCVESPSAATVDRAGTEDIPILWQASGTYSRLARRVRVVVRDEATLAQLPLTEVPIDFRNQMALVAGLGPTVGNKLAIAIVRVWRDGARIRVQERRIHPGAGAEGGLEPASPWTIVVIPRSDLNVEGYSTRVPPHAWGEHPGSR